MATTTTTTTATTAAATTTATLLTTIPLRATPRANPNAAMQGRVDRRLFFFFFFYQSAPARQPASTSAETQRRSPTPSPIVTYGAASTPLHSTPLHSTPCSCTRFSVPTWFAAYILRVENMRPNHVLHCWASSLIGRTCGSVIFIRTEGGETRKSMKRNLASPRQSFLFTHTDTHTERERGIKKNKKKR